MEPAVLGSLLSRRPGKLLPVLVGVRTARNGVGVSAAKKPAHTPGEWKAVIYGAFDSAGGPTVEIKDARGRVLVKWVGFEACDVPKRQHGPNALLMAAAPEQRTALLAAPSLPVGFMEWKRAKQLDWLCDYADWWRDVRQQALEKSEAAR